MNRALIVLGASLLIMGVGWSWFRHVPLFRLPGDIVIERPGFRFFLPITIYLQSVLGFSPMETLVAATRLGGEIMGQPGELGVVKAGALADLDMGRVAQPTLGRATGQRMLNAIADKRVNFTIVHADGDIDDHGSFGDTQTFDNIAGGIHDGGDIA